MLVMGIDASTTSTGYCLLDNETNKIVKLGSIKPNKELSSIERIIYIERELKTIWREYEPCYVLIEEMATLRNANVARMLIGLVEHLVIEFTKYEALVLKIKPTEYRKGKIRAKYREDIKFETIQYVNKKYGIDVNDDEADSVLLAEYDIEIC